MTEPTYETDANNEDTDGDGITDGDELMWGTSMLSTDSDGDGVSDAVEAANGSDPSDASDGGNPANCIELEAAIDNAGTNYVYGKFVLSPYPTKTWRFSVSPYFYESTSADKHAFTVIKGKSYNVAVNIASYDGEYFHLWWYWIYSTNYPLIIDGALGGVFEAFPSYIYYNIDYDIDVPLMDIDGDFNYDGVIDSSDPDDPTENTDPGLLIPLSDDAADLIKIHLELLPHNVHCEKIVLSAIRPADSGHIKVWSSPSKSAGTLLLDTTNSLWQKEWILSATNTFGDISQDLYVEGTDVGEGGAISLSLDFMKSDNSYYICYDVIKVSVITPELDIGETSRPANRIGLNDPRTVENAKNKLLVWSTDTVNDKTEYNLLKHTDTAGVFYKIEQRQNWNTGYPKIDTLTVNSLTKNPIHAHESTSWDFKVWYGPTAAYREKNGPYEIYAVSDKDYDNGEDKLDDALIPLMEWADAVYKRFKDGNWSGSAAQYHPTSIGSVSFMADQPEENVPYADMTHKFGAAFTTQPEITINGRRYPQTLATVPVYYWSTNTPVNDAFRGDGRVEEVIKAFIEKIPYDELNSYYEASSSTGTVRTVQWGFSMVDHHKLYWTSDTSISLTGGNDTLLYAWWELLLPPWTAEPLGLGDVWVVGSDPANKLYGGGGYIKLTVEKLTNGDLKVHNDPFINMTVEDMFDFNYWNGPNSAAAASIQCAYGHKGTGVGQAALLRFDVEGDVKHLGEITIIKP